MWKGSTELAMSMSAGTGDTTSNFLNVFDALIVFCFSTVNSDARNSKSFIAESTAYMNII